MLKKIVALTILTLGCSFGALAAQKQSPISDELILFLITDEDGDKDLAEVAKMIMQATMK